MKLNATITKIDDKYNLITLKMGYMYEYYLEKVGFGHLYFVVGICNKIYLDKDYLQKAIQIAEEEKFWGKE